ncbi:MAG: ATP-dependent DNA helicase RecG [Firmicutes bacterium]|nr:ATP-dependent DNA helicase RecG [Bacillota bacterium]
MKSVNKNNAELFKKIGIFSVGSLIEYYPVSYENWTDVISLNDCTSKKCVTKVEVVEQHVLNKSKKIYKIVCIEDGNPDFILHIIFFNQRYIAESMKQGHKFLVMGDIKRRFNKNEFETICPKVKSLKFNLPFEPIYSQIKGLPSWKISKSVNEALSLLPDFVPDTLPKFIVDKYNLVSFDLAIRKIHFPESQEDIDKVKRRFMFEELLIWFIAVRKLKNRSDKGAIIENKLNEFLKLLPFELTSAQKRAINTCASDMKSGISMRRLLQGDVGSGKTAVAMALAFNTIMSGFQVAFMAPTEVLATQHFRNFTNILKLKDIYVLTGSNNKKERSVIIEIFEKGNSGIIIGTHALTSDGINFKNLALVITDEQHKFGVNQRSKLINKGNNPHTLIMSATPIPRSLAMVMYGDMNFCVLDELPLGRQKTETFVIDSSKRDRAFAFLKSKLKQGLKGYIICAKVEEDNEEQERITVEGYEKKFTKNFFKDFKISLLHGKMKSLEKEKIMKDFSEDKVDLLISTTVVEVGVDVPKACVIIIENAEKFGLASLHQLRGRVGRSNEKSYCILISENKFGPAGERLRAMKKSNNGFYLAKKDLEIRGPGEFFGKKQHGDLNPRLKFAFQDSKLIDNCNEAADKILEKYPNLEDVSLKFIKNKVQKFFNTT